MHHSFDISIAEIFGVNVAIFLNNMSFWIHKNIANEKHFYDGNYWTYNSVKAYKTLFPYWTDKQLRLIIDKCLKYGLIVKGNYNKSKYDQTSWYAFTAEGLKLLNITICPDGQINSPDSTNLMSKKDKPIPDINTDFKTDKNKEEVVDKFSLPEWIPQELWDDFKENRKKIKEPMSIQAEKLLVKKLENLRGKGFNIVELLEESIINNWKSVFEPKRMAIQKSKEENSNRYANMTDYTKRRLDGMV